jgi:hypothetical protein
MGKTGRVQTPAQKAASERNLRKGNPRAYQGPAEPAPSPTPEPAKPRTVRARAAPAKRTQPKPRRAAPRAPATDEPAKQKKSGGGFLTGFLEGFG